ncbi:MAG: glycosyl hydrolase family 18 protein [Pseudomonadota bacterium]
MKKSTQHPFPSIMLVLFITGCGGGQSTNTSQPYVPPIIPPASSSSTTSSTSSSSSGSTSSTTSSTSSSSSSTSSTSSSSSTSTSSGSSTSSSSSSTSSTSSSSSGASTTSIVGGYWPNWTTSPVRIRDVHSGYNLIYLFSAQPVGGAPGTTGAVFFNTPDNTRGAASNFANDIQYARTVQNRKVILSVGGAGNGMSFPNRTKSQTFVNSIVALYNQFGGFDGLDWNTFEADQDPDTAEMMWISLELKRRYPGFLITSPPAPWNNRDKTFCQTMIQAGAMDYAAPQYYDGPGLNEPSYIINSVNEWVTLVGANHLVVGFGIWNQPNYSTLTQATTAWNQIKTNHPAILGAFNWQIHTDESFNWQFGITFDNLLNLQ